MGNSERRERIRSARTFLFVPADKPLLIQKALGAATDAVIIDLEDAVRPENKQAARSALEITSRSEGQPLIFLRINAFGTAEFDDDVRKSLELDVDGVVIPKFVPGESAMAINSQIQLLESGAGYQGSLSAIGLVESTAGILALLNTSNFPDRIERLAFGGADLYADLGVSYKASGPNTDLAMAALVLASAHSKLAAPLDTPHFSLDDDAGLADRSRFASNMGFGGKLCIHPKQLEIVNEIFSNSTNDQAWAKRVMQSWEDKNQSSGAIVVDGELVDEAMIKRARQILGLL